MSVSTFSDSQRQQVLERVQMLMRRDLKLGNEIDIEETTPFSGGEADMDSLDILLMVASVEKEFGIRITNAQMGEQVFRNVGTLVDYLIAHPGGETAAVSAPIVSPSDLLQKLPHQPPFRFVSKLIVVEPGKSAQGVWSVTGEEDFFAGHFPGRPIVPGALIAEALAQLSGLAANVAGADGRLAQMDVRFESAVAPPADIELRSRVARTTGSVIQYEVQALCGQKTIATGTITLGWTGAGATGGP